MITNKNYPSRFRERGHSWIIYLFPWTQKNFRRYAVCPRQEPFTIATENVVFTIIKQVTYNFICLMLIHVIRCQNNLDGYIEKKKKKTITLNIFRRNIRLSTFRHHKSNRIYDSHYLKS